MKHYRSSIPKAAQERIVSVHQSTGNKQKVECVLDGEVVGVRWFSQDGVMGLETPLKNGLSHGAMYSFDLGSDGTLRVYFTEPYLNGLAHGTARQWSEDGLLIGTYIMRHGTGLDLWRHKNFSDGPAFVLLEARYIKNGKLHGFEWWLEEDQANIHEEAHFWEGLQHGIRREWNNKGKLRRGYPQYWVNNERVSKRQYLRAQTDDPNLPPFREIDNLPKRRFPPEVRDAIKQTASL